jgi:hypothetical protein
VYSNHPHTLAELKIEIQQAQDTLQVFHNVIHHVQLNEEHNGHYFQQFLVEISFFHGLHPSLNTE